MGTEIYYFSGTGNSLHAARELQKRIPDCSLIPIVSLLNKDKIETNGECIGLVFPVHALTIPIAVKRFLKLTELRQANYIFAVATRGGFVFNRFSEIDKILIKQRIKLNARFLLNMSNNDPKHKGYATPTKADIAQLELGLPKQLDTMADIINSRKESLEGDTGYLTGMPYTPFVNKFYEKFIVLCMALSELIGGVNYFCTDSKCTGCGICEKVCLSRKIEMKDKKPLWHKKRFCYMCYACINYCPSHSIQINDIPGLKSFSRINGRYSHPHATVSDISRQKWE